MRMLYRTGASLVLALASFFLLWPLTALAEGDTPASTHTVAAGPYVIDVKLYEDPPFVDKMIDIAVTPHQNTLHLEGEVKAVPGLGTEALPLTYHMTATNDNMGTLRGQFRLPVRGAWDLQVHLTGPQGDGTAKVSVVAAAPGAIPTWLGWLIGSSPLVFIAFWIWHQHRYRNKLATTTL